MTTTQRLDVEQRSQRSASADDRSNTPPFSVNESELYVAGQNDYDSARASFADWVEIFESRIEIDGQNISTTARPEVGFDFEPSEEQGQFQLADVEDLSVIDPLNAGFINEQSMINPSLVMMKGIVRMSTDLGEVKDRLANLEVKNFSITEMIEKNQKEIGRKTHQVQKAYFGPPELTFKADSNELQKEPDN